MRILMSDSTKGVYHRMVKEIINSLNQQHKVTVLVPDRFTMSVERGLLESLGKESSFLLEVQSFNYLARNELNKRLSRYLTPQGSVMLMADVIDKNKDDLVYYKKAAGKNGFADEFSDAINIIRRSGINPEDLMATETSLQNNVTAQKAHDLALIFNKYMETLGEVYSDASTRLEVFADWLRKQDMQDDHDYFIMDYYDLSAIEIKIINALDCISKNVCLGLAYGFDNENKEIFPAEEIIKRIKKDNQNVVLDKERYAMDKQQSVLSKYLFSYKIPKNKTENEGKYNIYVANSVYEELLRVAIDIKDKIIKEKARYFDFEVVCAQPEIYYPQLKAIFKRLDIPFFIDQKEPLMAQTQIRFLLSMLEVVRTGYRREEVLSFVKNPLFITSLRFKKESVEPLKETDSEEEQVFDKTKIVNEREYQDYINVFENYVLKYSINYTIFKNPFDITPGKDKYLSKQEYEIAEFVRKEMYEFISVFEQEDLTTAAHLADAVKNKSLAIKDLWNYHKIVIENINSYYSKCAEQVNKKIDMILEEIKEIMGDTPKDIGGFIDMFKSMIENDKISLIPTYRDCVYVGDLQSRFMGLGKIYIVGAAQGVFPNTHKSGIIISDKDEENLSSVHIDIIPRLKDRNNTEKLAALEILIKSKQETDISYSESTPNGASKPSFVLTQMKAMLVDGKGKSIDEKRVELDDVESLEDPKEKEKIERVLFSTEESKYYSSLRNLFSGRVEEKNKIVYGSVYKTLNDDSKKKIQSIFDYPETVDGEKLFKYESDASTSISKIETFYKCPYQYFLSYGLGLRERSAAEMLSTETGTIIHSVLEIFFKDVMDNKVSEDNLVEKIDEAFDKTLENHQRYKTMASGDKKRLFTKIRGECQTICKALYANSCKSLFKPKMIEQEFGIPGKNVLQGITFKLGDKEIIFKGKIDRVDEYDNKVYVLDYKTYKSADINLTKLYYGEQIQLFLYMRALQNLEYNPIGVFYQPIYATYDKDADINRYKFKGVVHNTPGIQEEIDPDYNSNKELSFAAYGLSGKGKNRCENPEIIMEPANMDLLGRYSEDIAKKGVEEILNGYIAPKPIGDTCSYCSFKDMCGFAQQDGRNANTTKLDSFTTIYAEDETENIDGGFEYYGRTEDLR